jgi:flagellar biogenesis protein FliO
MSEAANKAAPTTDVGSAVATKSFMHWPEAAIALGLWLAIAWVCVLAYGLVKLIELSIT